MDEKFPYGLLVGLVAASAITFIAWPSLSKADKKWHVEIVDTNPTSLRSAFLATNAGPLFTADQTNGEDVAKALLAAAKASGVKWYTNVALTKEQLQEADVQRTLAALNRIITADVTNYVLSGPDGTPSTNFVVHDPVRPAQIDTNSVAVQSVLKKHPEWFTDEWLTDSHLFTNGLSSYTNITKYNGIAATNPPLIISVSTDYIIPGPNTSRPVWMPFPKFKVKESPGSTMNTFEYIFESEIEPVVTKITNVYGALRWEVRIK